jgi:hypothetical protein
MKSYKDPTADEAIGRVMAEEKWKRRKPDYPPRSPHTIHYRDREKVPGRYIKVNAHFLDS